MGYFEVDACEVVLYLSTPNQAQPSLPKRSLIAGENILGRFAYIAYMQMIHCL